MSNPKSSTYALTKTCIDLMNHVFKVNLLRGNHSLNKSTFNHGIIEKYMSDEKQLQRYEISISAPTFALACNPTSKGVKIRTIIELTFTTLLKVVQTIEVEQNKEELLQIQKLILQEDNKDTSINTEGELQQIDLKVECENLKSLYQSWLDKHNNSEPNRKISDEPEIDKKYNKFFDVLQNISATTSKSKEVQTLIKPKIIEFCEQQRLLGTSKPILLDKVYVNLEDDISIPKKIKEKLDQDRLRLLIVGSLGYGKTTFLKKLALSVIKEPTLNAQVPFFVNLREYIDSARRNTLFDFIANLYGFTEESSKENLQNLFKGDSDNCVFLLDSLDQISDERSMRLISEIAYFVSQYPHNDYILSARDSVDISRLENFEVLNLQGINSENKKICFIKETVNSLNEIVFNKHFPELEINKIVNKVTEIATTGKVKDLMSKPLLLALVCYNYYYYYKQDPNIEENKYSNEWYIVHDSARFWIREQNRHLWNSNSLKDSLVNEEFIFLLLEFIAFRTLEDKILNVPKLKLSGYISEFIEIYIKVDRTQETIKHTQQVLSFLEDIYGFTIARKNQFVSLDGIYSFPHMIFRRYFAVRYILKNYSNDIFLNKFRNLEQFEDMNKYLQDFPEDLKQEVLGLGDEDLAC